jgi:DNA-binding NarL/FixJ family response regulator
MEHRPVNRTSDVAHVGTSSVRDVLIVEDHPLMGEALLVTLSRAFGLRSVRLATSLAGAEAAIRADGVPDAVVLDLNLPDAAGVEGVILLRQRAAGASLTVISADIDPRMVAATLAAGARGYLSKSLPREEMVDAFSRIWAGETVLPEGCETQVDKMDEAATLAQSLASLTPQQMNILRLICQGSPNKIISYELSISEATVKTHIAAIMSKIKVSNRTQAALMASKARLFTR